MANGVAGLVSRARTVAYRGYYRLARANYEREWLPRSNRTPAGTVRCYEPLNRHGRDAMLAAVADDCGTDDVVYDVGANVGIYALALASDASDRRVVAVEPSPPVVDRLRTNVALNDLADRVAVERVGLGDERGERPFYVSTCPELSGFDRESATRWAADVAAVRSVPVRRLDDLVADHPPPDVVKVDVEGAAPTVLRGARETLATHRPTVFLEPHDAGLAGDVPGEARAVLEDAGYEVHDRGDYWRCSPR